MKMKEFGPTGARPWPGTPLPLRSANANCNNRTRYQRLEFQMLIAMKKGVVKCTSRIREVVLWVGEGAVNGQVTEKTSLFWYFVHSVHVKILFVCFNNGHVCSATCLFYLPQPPVHFMQSK